MRFQGALLLATLASAFSGECLPDALRYEDRKNLTYPGYNGPLLDIVFKWSSASVVSGIAEILLTEVLGYHYEAPYSGWATQAAVLGPSGCADMFKMDGPCDVYDEWAPKVHMGLEGWSTARSAIDLVPAERRATQLAKHTYRGVEGMFIRQETEQRAFFDEKLILTTYKGWNQTAFPTLRAQFDTIETAVPKLTKSLLALKDSGAQAEDYTEATGDEGPNCFDYTGAGAGALSSDDVQACAGAFWVSPACRAEPKSCIPVFTTSTWGARQFRQWPAHFDMPLAIVDTTWGSYTEAPVAANVPFYWWYPDATFAALAPQLVQFPEFNADRYQQGVYDSAMPDTELLRFVWHHMETADGGKGANIVYLLNRISIYRSEIDGMMTKMAAGESAKDIACEFLHDYSGRWAGWIPDLTQCAAGEGFDGAACAKCEAGFVSTFDTEARNRLCAPCSAGFYCPEGALVPTACDAGSICPFEEMSRPQPCSAGTSTDGFEGQEECVPCAPGSSNEHRGAAACAPCAAGHFAAEVGQTKCDRCRVRTWQDQEGQQQCNACPSGFTSSAGSAEAGDCVCPYGKFFAAITETCEPCAKGALCLEGKGTPLLLAGFYGEEAAGAPEKRNVWDADAQQWVRRAAEAEEHVFRELKVWTCPHGDAACPGRTVELESGAEAEGARRVGECAGGLLSVNGCAACPAGSFFSADTVECVPCAGGDIALYPIIYVLGLFIMLGLYKVTKDTASQKLTNMLMFSCSAALLVNFFQLLGVIGFYAASFPAFLQPFFDFFKLFVFDMDVLRASCALGASFESRFLTRTVSPLVFFLTFACFYPLSKIAHAINPEKIRALEHNNMLNAMGLIANAGFISLCKVSLQFYECREQPNAAATVASYPDVNCQSDQHNALLAVAVLMTLLYVGGIYFVSIYLCYVAPKRMQESRDFRRKTRFLVGRWNPGRWYWGPCLQSRNLLIAFVAVAYPSDGLMQFLVTGAIVVIYTAAQATMEPWRDLFLNVTDTVLGLGITLTCMFGVLLVSDFGDAAVREAHAQSYLVVIFVTSFAALGYAVFTAVMAFVNPSRHRARDNNYTVQATKILLLQTKKIFQLGNDGASEDEIAEALGSYLTYAEQKQIFKLGKVLLHELCGVKYSSGIDFKRLMINKIEGDAVPIETFDTLLDVEALDEKGNEAKPKLGRVSAMSKLGGQFR